MGPFPNLAAMMKSFWMRFALRGVRYKSDYTKLDAIYEEYRFAETNRLILEKFGRVGSLLEVGCGEGHQSLQLWKTCDRLIGCDVSARAVKRAGGRCPKGEFLVGDIFSDRVLARAPFDLVVACEVLYYMSDVGAALRRMRELGRNSLVTYFGGEMETLDSQVLTLPGAASEILEFEGVRWRAAWWPDKEV
jgi:SAM-dependent methyltransferase